jgi:eukaryotic-like serine/threonine-protein kinase
MNDGVVPGSTCLAATEGTDSLPPLITELVTATSPTGSSAQFAERCSESMDARIEQSTTVFQERAGQGTTSPGTLGDEQTHWNDLIGRRLSQYRIESFLGRGSMARVYMARHLGLDRVCALKIMDLELVARQPAIREQFWAEARAAANLVHPHVVTVHNLGIDQGYHYIEMEFVPGAASLRDSLIRQGPFEPVQTARLVRQVVLALSAAHRAGLVHRDVKPANVLLTPQGNAKLADFGLVQRLVGLSSERVAGTPTFMAPELFQGVPASPQSDIYAAGVMLFYLLSGRLPFASESIASLIALHQAHPVPDIREMVVGIPESLATILKRCLAKSPSERFPSTDQLAEELLVVIQQLRDTESLVRDSVVGLDCFIQGSRDSFRIILPQQRGERLQEVLIEVNEGKNGERYLSVFSVCGPADPAHYASALALNDRLTYGSLSIRPVLGTPMFVMSRTFPRDRVRPRELRDSIIEIARRSDQIEQQLTQLDLY